MRVLSCNLKLSRSNSVHRGGDGGDVSKERVDELKLGSEHVRGTKPRKKSTASPDERSLCVDKSESTKKGHSKEVATTAASGDLSSAVTDSDENVSSTLSPRVDEAESTRNCQSKKKKVATASASSSAVTDFDENVNSKIGRASRKTSCTSEAEWKSSVGLVSSPDRSSSKARSRREKSSIKDSMGELKSKTEHGSNKVKVDELKSKSEHVKGSKSKTKVCSRGTDESSSAVTDSDENVSSTLCSLHGDEAESTEKGHSKKKKVATTAVSEDSSPSVTDSDENVNSTIGTARRKTSCILDAELKSSVGLVSSPDLSSSKARNRRENSSIKDSVDELKIKTEHGSNKLKVDELKSKSEHVKRSKTRTKSSCRGTYDSSSTVTDSDQNVSSTLSLRVDEAESTKKGHSKKKKVATTAVAEGSSPAVMDSDENIHSTLLQRVEEAESTKQGHSKEKKVATTAASEDSSSAVTDSDEKVHLALSLRADEAESTKKGYSEKKEVATTSVSEDSLSAVTDSDENVDSSIGSASRKKSSTSEAELKSSVGQVSSPDRSTSKTRSRREKSSIKDTMDELKSKTEHSSNNLKVDELKSKSEHVKGSKSITKSSSRGTDDSLILRSKGSICDKIEDAEVLHAVKEEKPSKTSRSKEVPASRAKDSDERKRSKSRSPLEEGSSRDCSRNRTESRQGQSTVKAKGSSLLGPNPSEERPDSPSASSLSKETQSQFPSLLIQPECYPHEPLKSLEDLLQRCTVGKAERWVSHNYNLASVRSRLGISTKEGEIPADLVAHLKTMFRDFVADIRANGDLSIYVQPILESSSSEPEPGILLLQFLHFLYVLLPHEPDMIEIADFVAKINVIACWCREIIRFPDLFPDILLECCLAHLQRFRHILDHSERRHHLLCIIFRGSKKRSALDDLRGDLLKLVTRREGAGFMTIARAIYFSNSVEMEVLVREEVGSFDSLSKFREALECHRGKEPDTLFLLVEGQLHPRCSALKCHKRTPFQCCGLAFYCSEVCRDMDWKRHKKECEHGKKTRIPFEQVHVKEDIIQDEWNKRMADLLKTPKTPKVALPSASFQSFGDEFLVAPLFSPETRLSPTVALTKQDLLLSGRTCIDYFIVHSWGNIGIQFNEPTKQKFRECRLNAMDSMDDAEEMYEILIHHVPQLRNVIRNQLELEYGVSLAVADGERREGRDSRHRHSRRSNHSNV